MDYKSYDKEFKQVKAFLDRKMKIIEGKLKKQVKLNHDELIMLKTYPEIFDRYNEGLTDE